MQEHGIAGPGLLAHVAVSKFCDHLPLHRIDQILAQRYKINLPRQTLARWMELCADWLMPIYQHIRTGVMAGGYSAMGSKPLHFDQERLLVAVEANQISAAIPCLWGHRKLAIKVLTQNVPNDEFQAPRMHVKSVLQAKAMICDS